jgi:hypothetical protein
MSGTNPDTTHPGPPDGPGVRFDVTLRDGSVEHVTGADAYQQEGTMTTFFRTEGRRTVDCWAVRMASFRTDQVLAVRRRDAVTTGAVALRAV